MFLRKLNFPIRKWFFVFILAFGLNLIWENLHSFLYVHYQGGAITGFILARAALVDALVILVLIRIFCSLPWFPRHSWLIIFFGVAISLIIEYWALETNRWAYGETMPIIPLIGTGLTPTIQLGLLAYLVYLFLLRPKRIR